MKINIIQIFGLFFLSINLLVFVFGFAHQAYLNQRKKTVRGLSIPLFALTFMATSTWLIYGLLINNWPIIIPNIAGVILSIFVIYQIIIYKDANRNRIWPVLAFVILWILFAILVYTRSNFIVAITLAAGVINWGLAFVGYGDQAFLNYKHGVKNLSPWLYFMNVLAFTFAIIYGYLLGSGPLVWGSLAALVLTSLILGQILMSGHQPRSPIRRATTQRVPFGAHGLRPGDCRMP